MEIMNPAVISRLDPLQKILVLKTVVPGLFLKYSFMLIVIKTKEQHMTFKTKEKEKKDFDMLFCHMQ